MTIMRPRHPITWISWIVLAISVADFSVIALLPQSRETYNPSNPDAHELQAITVIRPAIFRCLGDVGLSGFFALLLLAAIGVYRRTYEFAVVLVCAACLGPVALLTAFIRDPAPWAIQNAIRASDGTSYCFAESSFLQGQRLVLAQVREETFWTQTLDVLVWTPGDSPRSYLRIVRPAGAEETYGQLYLNDGMLIGLRSENRCFFAYDIRTGRAYGYGAVEELSPFLALDQDSEPHEPDVAMLLTKSAKPDKGYPTAAALRTGLEHPNPRVRAIASQLLEAHR